MLSIPGSFQRFFYHGLQLKHHLNLVSILSLPVTECHQQSFMVIGVSGSLGLTVSHCQSFMVVNSILKTSFKLLLLELILLTASH